MEKRLVSTGIMISSLARIALTVKKPKAWRTVNQDIIVKVFDFIDDFREFKLTADLIRQFLLKGAHQDIGRDNIKILAHFFDDVFDL